MSRMGNRTEPATGTRRRRSRHGLDYLARGVSALDGLRTVGLEHRMRNTLIIDLASSRTSQTKMDPMRFKTRLRGATVAGLCRLVLCLLLIEAF
jgi:hypothetical protein